MAENKCTYKCGAWNCGSYQFNLHQDDIDQGNFCDVHYWQTKAQRPWVGLTDEYLAQIDTEEIYGVVGNHMAIAMAVEAVLKEKNG